MSSTTIYASLALAREEFPPVHKNKVADTGKYKYAYVDLQTVLEAVTPALRKQGLEIIQTVESGYLATKLVSVVDDALPLSSEVELPTGTTPQVLGSAITYARRYAIVTMLGLVTEDDDDGSEASGISAKTTTKKMANALPHRLLLGGTATSNPSPPTTPYETVS